jgi:hypothetical protein
MKLEFFVQIFDKIQISGFTKIRLLGAEFYEVGRTDVTKPIVGFWNFANAPNKNPYFVVVNGQ